MLSAALCRVLFSLSLGACHFVLGAARRRRVPAETLLDRAVLTALDEELSGVAAKDHVARLTQLHRVPASPGFHEAIEYVMGARRRPASATCTSKRFPGDGTTWFGTLHGNRGWRVEGGFLDEVRPQPRRIISYDDVRLAVADNSESADVTVDLVDVGRGTERRDYDGKDVRGKLVLCDATPSACHRQAVEEHGAAGLISYNSNQVSAWWRDDAGSDPLGPSRRARPPEHVCDHDFAPRSASAAAAARPRRAHHAARRGPRAQRRRDAVRDAGRDDSRHRSVGRRHRVQLPSRSREAGRQRQRQRLLGEPEIARTLKTLIDAKRIRRRRASYSLVSNAQKNLADIVQLQM